MKKWAFIVLLSAILIGFILLSLMNSRTFQFFGGIVNHVPTDEKVVALTFDDGPNDRTQAILDILENNGVKATFYLVGNEMEHYPFETKQILKAGHEIGNHSYSHQRMVFKSPSFIAGELDKTNSIIREAGWKGDITFRPPYFKKLLVLPYYLKKREITTVLADIEPESNPDIANDSDKIVAHVLEKTNPGSIILLHVWFDSRQKSIDAIEGIVLGLKTKGYQFVTVSELLEHRSE